MTWDLRLGDCIDGMAALADKSVDHAIFDPPYSEHVDGNSMRGHGDSPGGDRIDLGFSCMTEALMDDVATQIARTVRRWSVVFCDVESSHLWRSALELHGMEYVRTGAWVKQLATPQFTGDRPAVGFEAIVIAHQPGRKRWNGGGKHAIWDARTAYRAGDNVVHTTQKPERLMLDLVADFTDPGESILDPFAGSGTTGVAAIRLGRRFVGFEKDAAYHAKATARLASTVALPVAYFDDPRQGSLLP